MEHQGLHVLFAAVCSIYNLTRMHLAAQVTNRTCGCMLTSCNFSKVCSPAPNCIRENVALGKSANMSSSYTANLPSGPACLAVNGNTDTVYKAKNETNPNCIHTEMGDQAATWLVNLGQNYTIKNITVYIWRQKPQRMDNVIITVDDQDCYVFPTGTSVSPPWKDVSCTTPRRGSIVKFYKNSGDNLLNICEVQVWVCTQGLYGLNCEYKCNCKDNGICDNFFGTCTTGCREGFYGSNCTQTCGNCKESRTCDFKTGQCLNGCRSGWQEPMCTVCRNYTYGSDCKTCGPCRDHRPCNASNGACKDGCLDGFIGQRCEEICRNGTYGPNCIYMCGHCNGGNNCNASNGVCLDGCEVGYQLPLCNEKCPSGTWGKDCINTCGACREYACRHDNGICEKGCISGHKGGQCEVLSQQSCDRDLTVTIAGSVLGASLVISVSVITSVLIWFRRTSMKANQSPEPKSKVTYDSSGEMHSMPDLNFQENVYDNFETQEAAARPYTVRGKESHDDNDMHPTALENNYEMLAPQYQNSSADSNPYDVFVVSSK